MLAFLKQITFVIYISLTIWLLLAVFWFNPPHPGLFFVSLFVLILPLIFVIHGLLEGKQNNYIAASFIAIFYCVLALTELFGNPDHGFSPYITSTLSIFAYVSAAMTARHMKKVAADQAAN